MSSDVEKLEAAAQLLKQAELQALTKLASFLEACQKELDSIREGLPQTDTGSSAAKRIIAELSSQLAYRRTSELVNAIQQLDPGAVVPGTPMPPPPPQPMA